MTFPLPVILRSASDEGSFRRGCFVGEEDRFAALRDDNGGGAQADISLPCHPEERQRRRIFPRAVFGEERKSLRCAQDDNGEDAQDNGGRVLRMTAGGSAPG